MSDVPGEEEVDPTEALSTAAALVVEMRSLGAEVRALRTSNRRQGWWIAGLAVSVAIGIIASAFLIVGFVEVNDVSNRASKASNTVTVNCVAGNQARANERDLWEYVLQISSTQPPTRPLTPEQQQQEAQIRAQFQRHLDAATVQRDCSHPVP